MGVGVCLQVHDCMCWIAGQIGLVPETMRMVEGGVAAEAAQVHTLCCVEAV